MTNTKRISVRELCSIGIFTAIIAVCAQISIPMPIGVPMTLQTFAVMLSGIILGKRNGTLSALVYMLLGMIGIPVFSVFSGGMGIIFGKTGGFILSFPIMAFLSGVGAEKNNKAWLAAWLVIGAMINYLCGMLMFSFITSNTLTASFFYVVVPFIPTGIVKIVLVIVSGTAIKTALVKSRVLD